MGQSGNENYHALVLGEPFIHDELACNALKEYKRLKDLEEQILNSHDNVLLVWCGQTMESIALKYGTTIKDMKMHYRCLQDR